jgi:hypothetical protein
MKTACSLKFERGTQTNEELGDLISYIFFPEVQAIEFFILS